ncbi:MAG: adenylate/guanylate cyclase domain-containing protein [Gammaproteobacteria bacterium]|nr:adenylate/guanylate cyclase domain-containing protein [Gammaproteobacteria bacterium]
MSIVIANQIVSLFAIGLGLAFIFSDWKTVTSRLLALFLMMYGAAGLVSGIYFVHDSFEALPWWHRLTGLPVGVALVSCAEWVLRIRKTIPAGNLRTGAGDQVLRWAQVLGVLYAVLTIIFAEQRADLLMNYIGSAEAFRQPVYFLLAIPFSLPILLIAQSVILTLNRKPDKAEALRLASLVVASPFLASGFFAPQSMTAYLVVVGLIIFLTGSIEYHMIRGERGAFMSRFLAPQVAQAVQKGGLEEYLQEKDQELSVVYCDLRGFTAYSEDHESSEVIGLLRAYYDLVGEAAANYEATIKDYAGDGVMLLVGAPLPQEKHAEAAIGLATEIRDKVSGLLAQYASTEHPLGIGLGVATGVVSVGVVGGNRLEYAAVGSTVNLAARLCDKASPNQIRVSAETYAAVESSGIAIQSADALALKGFDGPVANYEVA